MINHEIPTISDPFGSASSLKPTGFSLGEYEEKEFARQPRFVLVFAH